VVVCLEQGADLHMAQLMPLPLTVSCFSKIQTGFAFLVPAHPGSPRQRAVMGLLQLRYEHDSATTRYEMRTIRLRFEYDTTSYEELYAFEQ